jgi:hypothetical protein
MNGERRRSRFRSFLLGGLVGSLAGAAAAGRLRVKQPPKRPTPSGLAAFEEAPCYQELLEREAGESR